MTISGLIAVGVLAVARAAEAGAMPPASANVVDFERDIWPIFEKSCLSCHGAERPKSRFSLMSREAALKGGDQGVAIIPGDGANSPLVQFSARLEEGMEMPPEGKGDPLTAEQIGLLRAWIDQGAQWSDKPAAPPYSLTITPAFRWIHVRGNERQFREHHWMDDGGSGGVAQFTFEQQLRLGERFSVEGSAWAGADDYRLKLSYEKNDVGFVRGGFEQFMRYSDDMGGYYAPFGSDPYRLDRDLELKIGRAWIDLGLTPPDRPRLVFGYEYQFKEGGKSLLAWSDVEQFQPDGTIVSRAIYPAFKELEEDVHILKLDVSHTIAGVEVEDNLRVELFDLRHNRVSLTPFELGTPPADTARRAREHYDHVQVVNTLRAEKEIRDWLLASGGYLYSRLDADAAFQMEFFQPSDPANSLFTVDEARAIALQRSSHVLNASARLGPWEGLTFSAGVQSEWRHEEGLGHGLQTPNPRIYSSQVDTVRLEEDFGLRFTRIPATVVYADLNFRQEWADHYEQDVFSRSSADFLRDTDAESNQSQYRLGFTVSPWRPLMFETHYRHRDQRSDYDHRLDQPGFPGDNGYPAFITLRDVELDEIEFKLTLRPVSWLKTALKYQLVATDYRTATDPGFVEVFDPITFALLPAAQPGGEVRAGNYDAHVYSLNAMLTPWRRLYLTATLSYADARMRSGLNGLSGVIPYEGDTRSILATANYAVAEDTSWTTTYSFSRSDYRQPIVTDGLPLGIESTYHGIMTGLAHRFTRRVHSRLQYGFYHYDEPTAGRVRDYRAHAILGMLAISLP